MAAPKTVIGLLNYDPQPTPLILSDMPRYTQNELGEIGSRLNVLTETFIPNVTVALTDISTDFNVPINPLWVTLTNYDFEGVSDFTDYVGMAWDPVAGSISFTGDPSETLTVEISATFAFVRGTIGFANNVLMRVVDANGGTKIIAANYIAVNNQDVFGMAAQTTFEVSGDASLTLEITAEKTGTITSAVGTFQVRPVTSTQFPRPLG